MIILCSLLVHLGLHITFPSLTFTSIRLSVLQVMFGYCQYVSCPPDKLAYIQQLALSLLYTEHIMLYQVMSFSGKVNFYASGHSQLQQLCHAIQSDMLTVIILPLINLL